MRLWLEAGSAPKKVNFNPFVDVFTGNDGLHVKVREIYMICRDMFVHNAKVLIQPSLGDE